MSVRNVTVTSKNQITLPSEYVKHFRLTQNRVLQAELMDGKIVLTPEPALGDAMRPFWGKHHAKRSLSDREIKRAARATGAKRAAKSA